MRNRADIEGRDCAIISRLFARSSPVLVFLLGFLVLVQVQCDRKKPTAILAGRVGSVSIEVQIPTLSAPEDRSAKATIIQGLLQITGDGMAPMDTTLQVEDGWIRGGIGGVPEGQRTVSLTLQDSEGDTLWGASTDVVVEFRKTATAVLLIQRVGDEAPEVTVTVSPDIGKVDTVFVAQAGAIDRHDPTDSLRVRWDFDGDGSFEIPWTTRKQISHSYIQAGSFSVALEVVDRTGNIGRATHQVKVFDITARGGMRDGPDTLRTGLDETVIPLDGVGRIQPEGALIYHWSQILDQTGSHDRSIVGTFVRNRIVVTVASFDLNLIATGDFISQLAVDDILNDVVIGDQLHSHHLVRRDQITRSSIFIIERQVLDRFTVRFSRVSSHPGRRIGNRSATRACIIGVHLVVRTERSRISGRIKKTLIGIKQVGGHPKVVDVSWPDSLNLRFGRWAEYAVSNRYASLKLLR